MLQIWIQTTVSCFYIRVIIFSQATFWLTHFTPRDRKIAPDRAILNWISKCCASSSVYASWKSDEKSRAATQTILILHFWNLFYVKHRAREKFTQYCIKPYILELKMWNLAVFHVPLSISNVPCSSNFSPQCSMFQYFLTPMFHVPVLFYPHVTCSNNLCHPPQ